MAPRTAKTKKADDVAAPDVAPKKGRSKAKVVEEAQPEVEEPEVIEKVATEKKPKRGKKAAETNGVEKTNGTGDEVPAKKGRKKKVPEPAPKPEEDDDNNSEKDDSPVPEAEQEENEESNGHSEEAAEPSGKKKREAKKEAAAKPEPKAGRGKRGAKQESVVTSQTENGDEKVKPAAKGRGRKAQPKVEETEDGEEVAIPEPATKGRKKGAKAKSPEPEAEEPADDAEETPEPEPEKKPAKGRKNQGKKGKAEDKPEEEPSTKKRKVNKKEEIGQGDTKDEEQEEVPVEEPKPKGKRGQKKAQEAVAETEEVEDTGEPDNKRQRKPSDDKAEDKKKAPLKNKADTNYEEIDFTNTSTNPQGKEWNFKISSWNVDGIRAWMTKGGLEYINYEKPDILCLQEVKCSKDKLPDECQNIPGYHAYWLCSDKDGYAGVGIYTTKLAMNVQYGLQNEELDTEGRIITAEYEHFYLICTYVPNAGRKLVTLPKRLQWNEEFRKHVKELDIKKPVIICGDMNVAHNEIDLANPKTNKKNAGFTVEERTGMTDLLGDGFVDTYRQINPETTGAYTFWTYMMGSRAKNVGWRLDYFIVSERLLPLICDSVIRDKVYGSDHCPISLFLHLTTADKPKEESPSKIDANV